MQIFKMKIRKLIIIAGPLFIFLLLCGSLRAQVKGDSLNYYLELAAKNNPGVLQKFSKYRAALEKVPQVGVLPDPELSTGVFLKPMELVMGKQMADIRLMQMFPWFGQIRAAKDEMSLMAKAKFEEFRDAKLQVYFEVKQTWYELYKIEKEIRISEDNLQIMRTIERLTLIRFKTAPVGGGSAGTMLPRPSQSSQQMSVTSGSSGMQSMGNSKGSLSDPALSSPPSSVQGNSMGTSQPGIGLSDLYRIQIEITDLENKIALLSQ